MKLTVFDFAATYFA